MINALSRGLMGAAILLASNFASARTITAFSLPWMNQTPVGTYNSADHANGVYVLELYFRTCPYCNDNTGNVDELASEYADNSQVQVLDIGIDRNDVDYSRWISTHNPNHPVLKDSNRTLAGQLGTTGYPSTYVVDCTNTVVYQTSGVWGSRVKAELRQSINNALTSCPASEDGTIEQ